MDEVFVDTSPSGPEAATEGATDSSETEGKKTPYSLVVSTLEAFFILGIISLNHLELECAHGLTTLNRTHQ